jgi:hypothetical protein
MQGLDMSRVQPDIRIGRVEVGSEGRPLAKQTRAAVEAAVKDAVRATLTQRPGRLGLATSSVVDEMWRTRK